MTPKEKAKELMLKYYNAIPMNTVSFAKQFALLAVDEILKVTHTNMEDRYWQEVKKEIENL